MGIGCLVEKMDEMTEFWKEGMWRCQGGIALIDLRG